MGTLWEPIDVFPHILLWGSNFYCGQPAPSSSSSSPPLLSQSYKFKSYKAPSYKFSLTKLSLTKLSDRNLVKCVIRGLFHSYEVLETA